MAYLIFPQRIQFRPDLMISFAGKLTNTYSCVHENEAWFNSKLTLLGMKCDHHEMWSPPPPPPLKCEICINKIKTYKIGCHGRW